MTACGPERSSRKMVLRHAIWKPLHGQWAVIQVRQDHIRDRRVKLDHFALCKTTVGEVDFLKVGQRQLFAVNVNELLGWYNRGSQHTTLNRVWPYERLLRAFEDEAGILLPSPSDVRWRTVRNQRSTSLTSSASVLTT
ncbi:MAG: hypothetical protein JWO94_514 [Verrucomicrobiaceae bacterium]|nr:hypothetical protein [Verrucomicrobiaceae bacterium]